MMDEKAFELIKRVDALRAWDADEHTFQKKLRDVPAVEPKEGEWIDKGWHGDWQFETDGRGNCWKEYECSECGFRNKGNKSNYCPNCGARMFAKDINVPNKKGADDDII